MLLPYYCFRNELLLQDVVILATSQKPLSGGEGQMELELCVTRAACVSIHNTLFLTNIAKSDNCFFHVLSHPIPDFAKLTRKRALSAMQNPNSPSDSSSRSGTGLTTVIAEPLSGIAAVDYLGRPLKIAVKESRLNAMNEVSRRWHNLEMHRYDIYHVESSVLYYDALFSLVAFNNNKKKKLISY